MAFQKVRILLFLSADKQISRGQPDWECNIKPLPYPNKETYKNKEEVIGPHIGRAYIEATININGLKMTVGTVHMSFVPYFATTLKKKKEFELLYKILRNKNTRFIFSGDLNARPNSYIVKVLKRNFRHCGPSLKQPTWTTKPFDYMGFKENKLRWRIDYVFATSDMRVLSSKIIKTKYSDHLPILVEFEI